MNPPKQAVSVFADTQSSEIKDRIFDEFNSLAVVYQKVILILFSGFIIKNTSVIIDPMTMTLRKDENEPVERTPVISL